LFHAAHGGSTRPKFHRVFTTSCHAAFTNAFDVMAQARFNHCLWPRCIGA